MSVWHASDDTGSIVADVNTLSIDMVHIQIHAHNHPNISYLIVAI